MSKTTIKAGYRIHVTTWENDADNYKTESMEGLTEGNVKFIIAICNLLKDGCNNKSYFGNSYDKYPAGLDEAIEKVIANFTDEDRTFTQHGGDFVIDTHEYVDDAIIHELGLSGGDFATRVFEKAVVEYIPEDIVIDVVTDRFI